MKKIGILNKIRRYPVKSMKGEDLKEVFVSYTGVRGDRIYAIVDENNKTNFPWLTARQKAELLSFSPRFVSQIPDEKAFPEIDMYRVKVTVPEGDEYPVTSELFHKYLCEKFEKNLHIRFSEKGMQDSRPVSLFGLSTLKELSRETELDLDHKRFRANCYVEFDDTTPFYEDSLVGKNIQIGEKLQITISKKDVRCSIVTIDPESLVKNPSVLSTIVNKHDGAAGVYAVVLKEGIIHEGDELFLL